MDTWTDVSKCPSFNRYYIQALLLYGQYLLGIG